MARYVDGFVLPLRFDGKRMFWGGFEMLVEA